MVFVLLHRVQLTMLISNKAQQCTKHKHNRLQQQQLQTSKCQQMTLKSCLATIFFNRVQRGGTIVNIQGSSQLSRVLHIFFRTVLQMMLQDSCKDKRKVPIVIKTNSFSTRSGNTSMLEQNILKFFAGGSIWAQCETNI